MKETRTRNWAFILYPESAGSGWREWLEELGVSGAVSPEHNKDKENDGTPKKPHYHVLMCFDGVKSYTQVCDLVATCPAAGPDKKACTIPQPIQSIKGATRYLVHKDNRQKAQYNPEEIQRLGGFAFEKYMASGKEEEQNELATINAVYEAIHQSAAETEGHVCFSHLVDWCRRNAPELLLEIRRHAYFYRQITGV